MTTSLNESQSFNHYQTTSSLNRTHQTSDNSQKEEKKSVKETVSINGKQYTVTVRFNEQALSQKYGVQGNDLEETVRKIIVSLKPQDLMTFAEEKVHSAHFQDNESYVKFQGDRTATLSELRQENPPLANAVDSIRSSFDKSRVKQLIAQSNAPREADFERSLLSKNKPVTLPQTFSESGSFDETTESDAFSATEKPLMKRNQMPQIPIESYQMPTPKSNLVIDFSEESSETEFQSSLAQKPEITITFVSTGKDRQKMEKANPRIHSLEQSKPIRKISENRTAKNFEMDINECLDKASSAKSPAIARSNLSEAYESLSGLGKLHLDAPDNAEINELYTSLQTKVGTALSEHSAMTPKEQEIAKALISATKEPATLGYTADFTPGLRAKLKEVINGSLTLSNEDKLKLEQNLEQPKNFTPASMEQLKKAAKALPKELRAKFKEEIKPKDAALSEKSAKRKLSIKTGNHLKPEEAAAIYTKILCDLLSKKTPNFTPEALQSILDNMAVYNPYANTVIFQDKALLSLISQTAIHLQLAEANGKAEAAIKNYVKFKKAHDDFEKQIEAGKIHLENKANSETRKLYLEQYRNAEQNLQTNLDYLAHLANHGRGSQKNIELLQFAALLGEITTKDDGYEIAADYVESLKTVDELNANVSSNFGTAFGAGAPPYISDVDTGPISNTLLVLQAKDGDHSALYQQMNTLIGTIKIAMEPGKSLKPLYEENDSGNKVPKENIQRTPEITQTIENMKLEMIRLKKEAEEIHFPPRMPTDLLRPSDVGNTTKEFLISTCEGTLKKLAALESNLVD